MFVPVGDLRGKSHVIAPAVAFLQWVAGPQKLRRALRYGIEAAGRPSCVSAESGPLAEKVDVFISHFLESTPYPRKTRQVKASTDFQSEADEVLQSYLRRTRGVEPRL